MTVFGGRRRCSPAACNAVSVSGYIPLPFFFFPENLEKYIISPSFPLTLAFLTLEDVSVTTNGSLIFGY